MLFDFNFMKKKKKEDRLFTKHFLNNVKCNLIKHEGRREMKMKKNIFSGKFMDFSRKKKMNCAETRNKNEILNNIDTKKIC